MSAKGVDTAGIFTDVTREVNDRKGLVIGGYVGNKYVDRDPSWIFRPQQANPKALDFVSLKSTILQASAITCSSLTVGGNLAATLVYVEEQITEAKAYTDNRLSGDITAKTITASDGFTVGDTIFKPEPSLGNRDNPAPLTINKTILPRPYEAVNLGSEDYFFRTGYVYDIDLFDGYRSLRNWMDNVTERLNIFSARLNI